ncbi:MAG: GNAT family N-acetyltransferase [Lachnospiraceae bacterium]|nr:GNAT family N-acetyltransferase [Lachnospiraceae bacterium]
MPELTQITAENARAFRALIRTDAYPFLADDATLGLGLVEKDTPVGALVMRPDGEGAARLLSLAIAEVCRRKGFATELLTKAADIFSGTGKIYRVICETTRRPGEENALCGLLESLRFRIEETDMCCYMTDFGETRKQKRLTGDGKEAGVTPYGKLTTRQKKMLYDEEMDLKPLMDSGRIEEKLSCVMIRDGAMSSCLVFVKEEDALLIQWARTSQKNPAEILYLMRYALALSKDYTDETKLIIPVLNGESKKLTEKLFGDGLKKTETGYRAVLPLYGGFA